ncbi:hypothetical protein [Haloferax sp. ATB1]|uniref:hypothetical protein n=1 Tax=Haloferax sp. ATB1 TaxID=1508454 RepID=UPI000FE144B0|nr:hypothetical protein [Haloferax sp. ATB1]
MLLDQSGGVSAGDLSGLAIDTDKDWGGYELTNVGKDGVRVPSSVDLTIEDWEGGRLPDNWTFNDVFSVQSSVVDSGNYSLKSDATGGSFEIATLMSGQRIERGDSATIPTYLAGVDAGINLYLSEGTESRYENTYRVEIREDAIRMSVFSDSEEGGPTDSFAETFGEWVDVDIELSETTVVATAIDSSGTELGSVSVSDSRFNPDTIFIETYSSGGSPMYIGEIETVRRTREYLTDTQYGPVELGGEVVRPKGALDAGPHEAVVSDTKVHAYLRTDDALAPGDDVSLVEWDAGYGKRTLKANADGEGGLYGLRRPRAARLTERLMWEFETLADVPNWSSASSGGNYTFSVTGRPRRLHAEHDGTGSGVFGAIFASALTTHESLGPFRITFSNVSYSANGSGKAIIGISNEDPTTRLDTSGTGMLAELGGGAAYSTLDNGNVTSTPTTWDWSTTHDISIEYDGSEVRYLKDGVPLVTHDHAVPTDYRPIIQLQDGSDGNAETLEVGEVIVEEL